MKRWMISAGLAAVVAFSVTPVRAQDKTGGVGIGWVFPVRDLSGPFDADVAVSAWLSGKIKGPFGWRGEAGYGRLRLPGEVKGACASAGLTCAAHLDVAYFGGGFHFEAGADEAVAPYAYFTMGFYRVGGGATVTDPTAPGGIRTGAAGENNFGVAVGGGVRFTLGRRWGVSAEGRYSGFTFGLGDFSWGSLITTTANVWVRF